MKTIIALIMVCLLGSCSTSQVLDSVETTSQKLRPAVEGWAKLCITARAMAEAAGEDTAELVKLCEDGWKAFQTVQSIQELAVKLAGGEPCSGSCGP